MCTRPMRTMATVQLGCTACASSMEIEVPIKIRLCSVRGTSVGVEAEEVSAWWRAHYQPTITLA